MELEIPGLTDTFQLMKENVLHAENGKRVSRFTQRATGGAGASQAQRRKLGQEYKPAPRLSMNGSSRLPLFGAHSGNVRDHCEKSAFLRHGQ
ncbi:hypothetical protein NO357_17805 [Marimonas arenosa]|uniref:Uncharacterized protein n=1 Tax=Marimonas arenosa TaxID=1795305 RepID=A0AAE4B5W2_9RHOB|nr:hypothetical protein [Marimonas arenosa]